MARIPKGQRTKSQQADATEKLTRFRGEFLNWFDASNILRSTIDENFKFNRGGRDQWDDKDAKKLDMESRPVLAFNACAPVVNFLAGYASERSKDLRYYPRGSEDELIGRFATTMAKYAMDVGQGIEQQHRLFRRGTIGGLSCLYLCVNRDYTDDLVEGNIDFQIPEPNASYFDPYSHRYDRQDSQFQGDLFWLPLDASKERWPQHAAQFQPSMIDQWFTDRDNKTGFPEQIRKLFYNRDRQQVRILRHYYRQPVKIVLLVNKETNDWQRMGSEKEAEAAIKQIYDNAGQAAAAPFVIETVGEQGAIRHRQNGSAQVFASPDAAEQALALMAQQAGNTAVKPLQIVTNPTTTMRVSHLTAWELLDDQPSPYGRTDEDGNMVDVDWRFPYIWYTPYQDTDDFTSIKGVINDVKDPQREINWYISTAQDKLVRGPKGIWLLQKGEHGDVNKLANRLSRTGEVLEYAGTPPQFVDSTNLITEELTMVQVMVDSIMRITGINAELLGQTTQKTVSGRSIQARQAGGLVGVASLFVNWLSTQKSLGEQLIRRIQQSYSIGKMQRILGDSQRMQTEQSMMGPMQMKMPEEAVLVKLKSLKDMDFDTVVEFQDHAPSARQAIFNQMVQLKALGAPYTMEQLVEASDSPYKAELLATIRTQGAQQPNPELSKVLGANQGGGPPQPNGVNLG